MSRRKKESSAPMGRPPAAWLHELMKLDLPDDYLLDVEEIRGRFGITKTNLQRTFKQIGVSGDYYQTDAKTIGKHFRLLDCKNAISDYLKGRGRA